MRFRHVFILASLGAMAAFAACTLNPQPLPPGDDRNQATNADASAKSDSGGFGIDPEAPPNPQDAAPGSADAQSDGDGGDAGDGGDGSADADSG